MGSSGFNIYLSICEDLDNLSAWAIVDLAPEVVPCTVSSLSLLFRSIPAQATIPYIIVSAWKLDVLH